MARLVMLEIPFVSFLFCFNHFNPRQVTVLSWISWYDLGPDGPEFRRSLPPR